MKTIKYLYPHWGSESQPINIFIATALNEGFDGIEINVPNDLEFQDKLLMEVETVRVLHPDFVLVTQQVPEMELETPTEHLWKALHRLGQLRKFKPNFINSHTGKDHFSFEENCQIIQAIEDFSRTSNIPVHHEIHRGRFTFHSATTLKYLKRFPQLKLVGDLSHWCVVSESMLEDQKAIIEQIIPHIHHIHARVGTTQSAQVLDPFAPENQMELDVFVNWWQRIVDFQAEAISITPEFGPFPYIIRAEVNKHPNHFQQQMNLKMKAFLNNKLIPKACSVVSL